MAVESCSTAMALHEATLAHRATALTHGNDRHRAPRDRLARRTRVFVRDMTALACLTVAVACFVTSLARPFCASSRLASPSAARVDASSCDLPDLARPANASAHSADASDSRVNAPAWSANAIAAVDADEPPPSNERTRPVVAAIRHLLASKKVTTRAPWCAASIK